MSWHTYPKATTIFKECNDKYCKLSRNSDFHFRICNPGSTDKVAIHTEGR